MNNKDINIQMVLFPFYLNFRVQFVYAGDLFHGQDLLQVKVVFHPKFCWCEWWLGLAGTGGLIARY